MADKKARRNTRQRQAVLEELRKLRSHPTAAELHEIARQRLPKLSLGTVYRNLELLAADGIIGKLELSGTESRFDGNPERHCHARCTQCGRVDDLHDVPADLLGRRFHTLSGYEIIDYRLEFVGVCPQCRALAPPKGEEARRREAD
jgi:Fur family ferric uptake transcriptional regulator